MKLTKLKGFFALAIAGVLALCCFSASSASVKADTSGTVTATVSGTYYAVDYEAVLTRLNEIRYEAYELGYVDTYVPLKWSSVLEETAIIRAAEADYYLGHTRTDGTSCFTAYPATATGENLAWNYSSDPIMTAIEQWYAEKYDYENNTGGQTGHYLNMIAESTKYVGLAAFKIDGAGWSCAAQCFGTGTGLDESGLNYSASSASFEILDSTLTSLTVSADTSAEVGQTLELTVMADSSLRTSGVSTNYYSAVQLTDGYTVTSSDESVLSVEGTTVTAVSSGTATITVSAGGLTAVTETITVHRPVADFVTRLYDVCLNREPDDAGKADWVSRLKNGTETGASAAYGFIFSTEFQNYNYCNTDYVKQLYRAFMGREYDEAGLSDWVAALESGTTREEVFNGFSQSVEFQNICAEYNIVLGDPIAVPQYGTVPHGACSVCGETDGVTAFVTRLYNICLDREPDEAGLADWTGQLWAHTKSGRDVAFGFIFSQEFINKNLDGESYVEYLYSAFFDRASDASGKADWLNRMANEGYSREDVFNGFVGSTEFDNLCKKYGITRD